MILKPFFCISEVRLSGTQSTWKPRPKNVPLSQFPNAQQNTKTNVDQSKDNNVKLLINKNVIHNMSSSAALNTSNSFSFLNVLLRKIEYVYNTKLE